MTCRFAAYALLAGLMLAGCTGRDPRTAPSSATKALPALTRAWTATPGPLWKASPTVAGPPAWTTASSIVVPGHRALTSYAAATGAKQWSLPLPAEICAIADAPNEAGIAAVLLGHGKNVDGEACATAAAIDTHTGRLLWTHPIGTLSEYGLVTVQIGAAAVAITNPCDAAVTLSVRDGAQLVRFPARREDGSGCRHTFASDGRTVVDGQSAITPESLVGYDAVTGRRLWTAPAARDAAHRRGDPEADRVISSDPPVIEASINGHRFLRTVDTAVGTATPFGRQSGDSFVPVFTRSGGSRVVVQYGQSSVLFAYDVVTGRQVGRTVLDGGETAIGMRDDTVITVAAAGPTLGNAGLVVRRTDPISGHREILGTGSIDGIAATFGRGLGFNAVQVGSTLVMTSDSGLTAYRLPASGPAVGFVSDPRPWAADDLRPAQVTDLCPAVTTATKRAFGFATPDLPAPADCGWSEPVNDTAFRHLNVAVTAVEPTRARGAVALARARVAQHAKPDSVNRLDQLTPVEGIGDEALLGTRTGTTTLIGLVVRRANVVIELNALSNGRAGTASEGAVLEHATRLAAADLVAAVDRLR